MFFAADVRAGASGSSVVVGVAAGERVSVRAGASGILGRTLAAPVGLVYTVVVFRYNNNFAVDLAAAAAVLDNNTF